MWCCFNILWGRKEEVSFSAAAKTLRNDFNEADGKETTTVPRQRTAAGQQ